MTDELLTLQDIADLYRCSRRHARDVVTKMIGFPTIAPGSTHFRPLWLKTEVRGFLHRKAPSVRLIPAKSVSRL